MKIEKEMKMKDVRRYFPEMPPISEDVYFEMFVCPNDALIMEFCKHGARLEVMAPEAVREAVAAELKKAAGLY